MHKQLEDAQRRGYPFREAIEAHDGSGRRVKVSTTLIIDPEVAVKVDEIGLDDLDCYALTPHHLRRRTETHPGRHARRSGSPGARHGGGGGSARCQARRRVKPGGSRTGTPRPPELNGNVAHRPRIYDCLLGASYDVARPSPLGETAAPGATGAAATPSDGDCPAGAPAPPGAGAPPAAGRSAGRLRVDRPDGLPIAGPSACPEAFVEFGGGVGDRVEVECFERVDVRLVDPLYGEAVAVRRVGSHERFGETGVGGNGA